MTAEELLLRRAIVCASGVLYWAGVLIQARRVRRKIGRSPNVRPRGGKEIALWCGWFLVILAWIGQPLILRPASAAAVLCLPPVLLHRPVFIIGLTLTLLGYIATLWTYVAMGNSWRMGVDARERTALVFRGPFHWVRHPIYLAQIIMLAGVALLLPNAVSFLTLAIHWVCVRIKARDEEAYLLKIHGPAYRDYSGRTGGLFPKLFPKRAGNGGHATPRA